MTNFEKIKQMDVEEFANKMWCGFNCDYCKFNRESVCKTHLSCREAFFEWLKEEVDNAAEDNADE